MAESHPCLISIGLKEDKKVQDEAIRTKKYTTKEQDLLLFTTRDDPFLLQITLLMKPRACEDHERVHAMSFASDRPLQCLHRRVVLGSTFEKPQFWRLCRRQFRPACPWKLHEWKTCRFWLFARESFFPSQDF